MKSQNIYKDKRGVTFSGWTEGILFSILFMFALATIMVELNNKYSKTYDPTFGLDTNTTYTNIINYQNDLQNATASGDMSGTGLGMTLTTSWGVIKLIGAVIWSFFTGGWVEKTATLVGLPLYVGVVLRVLYFISIGFIIMRMLFKVKV